MKQKPPQTLTIEECDKLLAYFPTYPPEYNGKLRAIRDSCMALVMLDAGLRVGEVIGIQRGDLCWIDQVVSSIRVQAHVAKRRSERLVPVTTRLTHALELMQLNFWIPDQRPQDETAFYHLRTKKPLVKQSVGGIIREAGRVSLHRDIHPHMLRHTFATNLMQTTNARVVQQLLGHKNLSSTQIYMHPNQQDLKKAIDSLPAGK
jgi:site-specific recombinase XerD